MERLLSVKAALLIALGAHVAEPVQAVESSFQLGLESAVAYTEGLPSWVDGSAGKFADFGSSDTPVRAFAEHSARLKDTVSTNLVLEATGDGIGAPISATEAYLAWHPVPQSSTRYRVKLGAFYPGLSLENTDDGWRSPYTLNYSAINSWVAEELRATGVEITAIKRLPDLGPAHRLIFKASVFGGNDPAGTVLSWRGWSVHDRQSRFGDKLPLQPLPLNRPGEMFEAQAPYIEPFVELDDRLGFYAAAEWLIREQLSVKGMVYDNRGDPEVLKDGQYAWDTRFNSLGLKLALPENTTLLAQWMQGNTGMGPLMLGKHVVDNDFDSQYLLLSRKVNRHRFSVRYDRFRVDDLDVISADNNTEKGDAWTLAYRVQISDRATGAAEWTRLETTRPGYAFNGFDTTEAENQLQFRFSYAF